MNVLLILGIVVGGLLGYLVFYIRYGNKSIVDDLRGTLKELQHNIDTVEHDNQEYRAQNVILRDKTTDLLRSNDELSKIVSNLSRYYYHMKLSAEKIQELSSFLKQPDDHMEDYIAKYAPDALKKSITRDVEVIDEDVNQFF